MAANVNERLRDKSVREIHEEAEQKLAEFQSLILSALSQLQQAKKGLNEYATIVLPTTTTTPQGENYMPDIARNLEGKCPDSLTKL